MMGDPPRNPRIMATPRAAEQTHGATYFALGCDHLHHRGGARDLAAGRERLDPAAQAGAQEGLGAGVEVDAVLGPGEAVPLVRVEDVGHAAAVLLDGGHDLLRLGLLHARVVGALADEERDLDLVGREERRGGPEQRLVGLGIAHALVELGDHAAPSRAGCSASSVKRFDGPTMSTAAREDVGREGHAGQRRVAAVGAAHDGDLLRVDPALLHRPVHARRAGRSCMALPHCLLPALRNFLP